MHCLAQLATLAWASKYGFATMQNLSQCPSYIRALESFDVPASAAKAPSMCHLTQKKPRWAAGHRAIKVPLPLRQIPFKSSRHP